MTELHEYRVGEWYSPTRTTWPDGVAHYAYRGGVHELLLFLSSPTPNEVRGVRQGEAEFGLVAQGPLIVLLYRFASPPEHPGARPRPGAALPWGDAPFTVHRVSEAERTLPELPSSPEERALLAVMLIDAATGIIRAIRVVSLSPAFTSALEEAIREQARLPYEAATYDRLLDALYARYPSSDALLALAGVRCMGGAP
jgi:hypothetical protein